METGKIRDEYWQMLLNKEGRTLFLIIFMAETKEFVSMKPKTRIR